MAGSRTRRVLASTGRPCVARRGQVARKRRKDVSAPGLGGHAKSPASRRGRLGDAALEVAQSLERRKRTCGESGAQPPRTILGTGVFRHGHPRWGASETGDPLHGEQSSEGGFSGGTEGVATV